MSPSLFQHARAAGSRRWPLVVSLVATLGFLGITVALLFDLRTSVETRARDNASNLLKVLERDVSRNIEVLDLSLQSVVDGVRNADVMRSDPHYRNLILFDRSTRASGLGALLVYDARGHIVFDSAGIDPRHIPPATDREYFQAQREADRGLFISVPYISRMTGTEVIGLSRRIDAPDGGFAGVALGSIETSYFSRLFKTLELGQNSVVSLVREDGTVLMRQQDGVGSGMPAKITGAPLFERFRAEGRGTVTGRSPVDGEERLYAFTRVGEQPIYLSVGLSTAAILAEWRVKAALLLALALLISALLVMLTIRLTRELRRRTETEATLGRLNAELAQLSATDSLTGLGNRRAFDAAISREIRRVRRTGKPLGLVMLDVDHFKLFNDRYGHQAGDEVLRLMATIIRPAGRRSTDDAFRIGGEEFAILLPGSDLAGSVAAAEALRTRLHAAAISHDASPLGIVTASLGVTEVGSEDAATALARADGLLYRAKRAGRDRVVAAPFEEPTAVPDERWSGMNVVSIGRRPSRADAA